MYVVVLDGAVHSVYLDRDMFELQTAQLDKNGLEYRTFELFANSSLKIATHSSVPELDINFPPYSESAASVAACGESSPDSAADYRSLMRPSEDSTADSTADSDATPVLRQEDYQVLVRSSPEKSAARGDAQHSAERSAQLLALYRELDALTGERIEAEMDYEDVLKEYHKELEVYDLKKNSYEDTRERFEEIWNIFQADRKIYQSVAAGAPCPQLFRHKLAVFERYSGPDDEQALFRHYVENYPENECDGLSETFRAFFVDSDAFWKEFFAESLDERVRKELRLKYMDAYVSDFDVYKANKMFDELKEEFFARVEAEAAALAPAELADAEVGWLDDYIRTFT